MGHIPEETIEQIRNRADLVDVISQVTQVQKRGNTYWCCCPFHHEKTPSFKIDPERQSYYCFGCKKSGNVFTFVKETVNTDFVGAVRWLADRLGITIQETNEKGDTAGKREWRDKCMRLLNDVAYWYHENLKRPEAAVARNYIQSRELDEAAVNHFNLGYDVPGELEKWALRQGYTMDMLAATGFLAEGQRGKYDRFHGRLMFPICDELGRVVGFSARILEQNPERAKYVNTSETDFFQKSQILYGYHFARSAFKQAGRALICEGQLDVIACHRAGITCAIASQGTAFTEQHARMLKRSTSTVTLAFDADTAGEKATLKTCALLHAQGLSVDVAPLPPGDDPDGIFRKGGATALQNILNHRESAIPYLYRFVGQHHNLSVPEELSQVIRTILAVIQPIPDPVTKAGHCKWLAETTGLPEQVIQSELKMITDEQIQKDFRGMRPLAVPAKASEGQRGAGRPLPAFAPAPTVSDTTFQCILALIITYQSLAEALASRAEIIDYLPDTPIGQAINQVLAYAEQGEWDLAAREIAASQLAEDPLVGKALANDAFDKWLPNDQDGPQTQEEKQTGAEKALNDCIARLELASISQKITEARAQLPTATPEQKAALQQQLRELLIAKQTLTKHN